jgi:Cd2+/Zn2+-exporting ATPase
MSDSVSALRHARWRVTGLDCPDCAQTLSKAIATISGVTCADLNYASGLLLIDYVAGADPRAAVVAAVRGGGYGVVAGEGAGPSGDTQQSFWNRHRTTIAVVGSGVAGVVGWALSASSGAGAIPVDIGRALSVAAYLCAVAFGLVLLLPRALTSLRGRTVDMNALMIIAVFGAIALGEYAEAAAVVFLFAIGGWLESRAVARTRGSIRKLMELTPQIARVRRDGVIVESIPEAVCVGETVVVRPGERFPLDGVVSSGASAADEAAITGESVPVDKSSGDRVFAGSLNTIGLLEVTVTSSASDSTLARIVYLVEEAAAAKAPTQLLIDRFTRWYTPVVVALAAAVWIVPVVVTGGLADPAVWGLWLSRALVVLVTACPCALVISTPVALVSAISRAARAGVLVKGGAFLELAAKTRAVAFDKTGTLTTGRLDVVRAHAIAGRDPLDVVRLAASLETNSTHPLAAAVVRDAMARGLSTRQIEDLIELPGRGVSGELDGHRLSLVSPAFAEEMSSLDTEFGNMVASAESDGLTVLVLVEAGVAIGFLGVSDEGRAESRQVLGNLTAVGIEHTALLTGDNERTAAAVAKRAGVSAFQARLLPQDKVAAVKRLQSRYGVVAMVGDGVNDAPALATADLGIAMGAAGSDTALEAADVALMSDDLSALPGIFVLGRKTVSIIKQNVGFSLVVKVLVLVAAVLGIANMWLAVFADTGVALLVILNSMRLLGGSWAGTAGLPVKSE